MCVECGVWSFANRVVHEKRTERVSWKPQGSNAYSRSWEQPSRLPLQWHAGILFGQVQSFSQWL